VENFGCRATQADGAALAQQFEARGLVRAEASLADLVILNTCTVTRSADQDARAAIRRVRRRNPHARILVTGCYAQRAPEEIAALPGVSAVIGNSHKYKLAEIALEGVPVASSPSFVSLAALAGSTPPVAGDYEPSIFVSDIFAHTELLAAPVFESATAGRTRPNLKVQDGCNNRCSFCVIPSVRGRSRSLPLEKVIDEVNALVSVGYKELVISGINLGRWGRDLAPAPGNNRHRLLSLIRAILDRTTLEKLRISSVEPMDWSDELISLVAASPRIARHAHVPLQSASDAVLRRMHRRYRPWHYREKIEKLRSAMPTAAIGADVMVGFPGESDSEFEATRRFIEESPFTYLHVFTYSPRPGTPAALMPNQVPIPLAHERNKILRDLAAEKKLAFMRSFVGSELSAITLGAQDGEFTEALTDNYQKLFLKGRHAANRWITARIDSIRDEAFLAHATAS
jgi:threonylcarbamoyladenosine tRNA methylthiotransferase MtaB